ncbi:MAG: Gfo/Idh/MocA family protein [Chloroflexota bacterium]
MAGKTVRVGLVGAGSIAQIAELPALAALPDAVIAGVVTRKPECAERNRARWPIERTYPNVEAMIDQARLDALFVLTPKTDHTRFVELGLRRRLDVFCEKPLASTLEEAAAMANLADETGQLLMVGFNRRYAEVYERAHQELGPGAVRFCVAQKNRAGSEYRATLENAIHMVDLLRWFCGEADEVTAHALASDPYQEEGTMALIRFSTGAVGVLAGIRCAGEWDERLDLYGNLTSVRVTAPDSVAVSRAGETRVVEMRPRAMGWAQVNTTLGFGPEVAHFIQCVQERRQPLTDGHEAVRTQELVERIIEAAGLPLEDRASQSEGVTEG